MRALHILRHGMHGARAWNAGRPIGVDLAIPQNMRTGTMNKDRIKGSFEQAKGKVKEVTGKATGDAKLENEGKAQQVAGKVQNTIGGLKDAVKEAVND
jgi:uncharacterized protein YjbJ (UPF0337 family)